MQLTGSIGQRIKQVRGELSQKAFGLRIGLSQTAVTALENDQSEPRLGTFNSIVEAFRVNPEWLRTGYGSPTGLVPAPAKPLAYPTAEPTLAAEPAPAYGAACVAPVAVVTLTAEVTDLRVENKELKAELKQARREAREDLVAQARLYNSVKEDQDGLINRLYAKVDEYELRLGIRQPTLAERERMSSEAPRMEVLPFGERYRATPATAQEPQAVADDEPGCVLRALYPEGYSYRDAA